MFQGSDIIQFCGWYFGKTFPFEHWLNLFTPLNKIFKYHALIWLNAWDYSFDTLVYGLLNEWDDIYSNKSAG